MDPTTIFRENTHIRVDVNKTSVLSSKHLGMTPEQPLDSPPRPSKLWRVADRFCQREGDALGAESQKQHTRSAQFYCILPSCQTVLGHTKGQSSSDHGKRGTIGELISKGSPLQKVKQGALEVLGLMGQTWTHGQLKAWKFGELWLAGAIARE